MEVVDLKLLTVAIPFLFYGTSRQSVLIIDDEIIGWGAPNATYFFQMWRSIPSHIIYYRDKLGLTDRFLSAFDREPVDRPQRLRYRYDYLVSGDVPAGMI